MEHNHHTDHGNYWYDLFSSYADFSADGMMPHGHCYLWQPSLVFLHVISDLLIALAYFCIPFTIYYLVRNKKNIPYKNVLVLFSCFIFACGATHLMNIFTLWSPAYWSSGMLKLLTASISVITAAALFPIIPKIMQLKSPDELDKINQELQKEIERRKLVESELRRSMDLKTSFLANMSHEIRTPLNGIIGLTGFLLETPLDEGQKRNLELVKNSGEHLFSLLNDILDFTKIEANKLELEEIAFELPSFLHELIRVHEIASAPKSISLTLETHDLPSFIKSDPTRLRQIFGNLISNAIKFTNQGSVKVLVKFENDTLYGEVSDTGIGIPADKTEQIFEVFSQADSSTARKFGGSGLGLTISKKLIELLGGQISVESHYGKGTSFSFFIKAERTEQSFEEQSHNMEHLKLTNKRPLLIAEDNYVNQLVTQKMIEKLGLTSSIVKNGLLAVESVKKNPSQVILMDCQMPEMDGFEATQKIRNYERENKLDPCVIIAMTASALKGDKEKCLGVGMDDYIAKPLRLNELYQVLKRYLD